MRKAASVGALRGVTGSLDFIGRERSSLVSTHRRRKSEKNAAPLQEVESQPEEGAEGRSWKVENREERHEKEPDRSRFGTPEASWSSVPSATPPEG